MKKILLILSFVSACIFTQAQSNEEIEIRKLEDAQREAFLKKDTNTLFRILSPNFIVNAPTNKIATMQVLKSLIRNGEVDMESFERVTERVTFTGDIAISMGNETLQPAGKMPDAGKIVKRRYTNIWMKINNTWQLVARQATIISVE